MIQSKLRVKLFSFILAFSSFTLFSQSIDGESHVACGAQEEYKIVVPGTLESCQGTWTVVTPSGSFTGGGSSISVNWWTSPGNGTVSFVGTCTYIPNNNGNMGQGGNGSIGGGSNTNGSVTEIVNSTFYVTIGNGRMPKPYLTGSGHFCHNQTKTFSISSVPNAVSYTYTAPNGWSINGGSNTLTTSALSINLSSPSSGSSATVFMKVRTNGPSCTLPSFEAAKTIRFGTVTPSIVGNSVVSPNSHNEYFGVNTEGLVNASWSKPSSWTLTEDYGVSSQVYQMPGSGSGTITLSGMSCGNSVQASKFVTISSGSFGGAKSANNQLEEDSKLVIFPNPASDKINIVAEGMEVNRVVLMSISGQVILEQTETSHLDVSSIPAGVYFLKVNLLDGNVITKKIEVQ